MAKINTLEITQFNAHLTRFDFGNINSGKAKYYTTWGIDAFSHPDKLTWNETPTQIDPTYSVLTDLIVAGKERVESGVSYVYAVGHTGRVYKIQVNDPATFNPDYDNPVLLTTLSTNSPTFTRGGSIEFYGATQRIYIGHDKGITRIDFDGTNETFIGVLGSWTQTVPRLLKQFIGKLYATNGSNIAEIDSTSTVTSYTRLNPGFPDGTQTRDVDLSPDGNYLQLLVSNIGLSDITSSVADTSAIANSDTYIFKWNGIDAGYTSFDTYSSYALTANITFGSKHFVFGVDPAGSALYDDTEKAQSLTITQSPLPNAVGTGSNMVGWATTELDVTTGRLAGAQFLYGITDNDFGLRWIRQFRFSATGAETDVVKLPLAMLVSSFSPGASSNGYVSGIYGFGKGYFSTLEVSSAPTKKYKFYKWYPVSTTVGTPVFGGIWESQNQYFSKRIAVKEVRVYGTGINVGGSTSSGWLAGNGFQVQLIDGSLNAISNGTGTFIAGVNLTIGEDFAWYNPSIDRMYSLGVRLINIGTTNYVINKIEVDYAEGGD